LAVEAALDQLLRAAVQGRREGFIVLFGKLRISGNQGQKIRIKQNALIRFFGIERPSPAQNLLKKVAHYRIEPAWTIGNQPVDPFVGGFLARQARLGIDGILIGEEIMPRAIIIVVIATHDII
jgi:hypothetical protein